MIMLRPTRPQDDDAPSRFLPGDLVRHRRYGYRGVVVDLDLTCTAPEEWYSSNQTQPERAQPWYHVLVDGSHQTTYAAQSNLEPDPNPMSITHPLLPMFFDAFENGHYLRNDRPFKA